MSKRIGVYLEAGYKQEGDALFCEDVYTILFNILRQEGGYTFSFLGRQGESKSGGMYRIEHYGRFFELTPFRDLSALCLQWHSFKRKNRATMDAFVQSVDKLLVMSPMPICIELIKLGIKYHKPIVLLARQDTRHILPLRYRGVKKPIVTCLAHLFERRVERLVQQGDVRVMALGSAIARRFRPYTDKVYTISTSPYRLSDVVETIPPIDWKGKVKLLFVGRVEVNKGLRELLATLSGNLPFDWTLTLVGDGAFMPEVNRLLAQYHIADNVHLTGYLPFGEELMELYKSHDILVLPSYSEGLPHVLLEAMAGGCLVAATCVGGIPDVVKPGQTGWLFPPESAEALRETLVQIYTHQSDVEQVRENALAVARDCALERQIEILKAQLDD